MERQFALRAELAEFLESRAVGSGVELGSHDDHRFFAELFAECQKFVVDGCKRVEGIGVSEIAGVNQVNEQARAFHMAQKANAETRPFVRAFDQARQDRNTKHPATSP